jgi:cellulose synthase (UDP-forming)
LKNAFVVSRLAPFTIAPFTIARFAIARLPAQEAQPHPNGAHADGVHAAQPHAKNKHAKNKHAKGKHSNGAHVDGAPEASATNARDFVVTAPCTAMPESGADFEVVTEAEAEREQHEQHERHERSGLPQRREQAMTLISAALIVVALACIVLLLPGGWVMLATLALGVSIALRGGADSRKLLTILLAATVGVTTIDYLTWRLEVSNWAAWWIAVPLLAAEAFGAVHTLGLQYTVWPWSRPRIVPSEDPARRPVFIFIPTVNEGAGVLAPTLKAALEARRRYLRAYPQGQVAIVLCNDGRVANAPCWREVESLAERMGVQCVTRTAGGGAKAGNIEHARQQVGATGDALVAIFDADQLARPDFLLKTVPPFADPTIGWVQTGQYYTNLEQPVAHWANDQQALFYRILCPGKAALNAAFICGTNVVLRATALDEIGGLPQDSVTEDFAASIALHPIWRSVFLTDVLATGLGPMDLPAYLKQQRRWAIGTLGVLRTHWRAIWLPRRGGLHVGQRLQYALACTHYLCGVRDLIYLVAPLAFLFTGIPAVRGATLALFLWHFVPYWIAAQGAFWYASRRETGIRGIIIGFGSFPVLIQALWTVITGGRTGFMVTSKQRRTTSAWSHLVVYLVAVVACFAGIVVAFVVPHAHRDSVIVSVLWVIYDIGLLGSVLWLGVRDLRYGEARQRQSVWARMQAWAAAHRVAIHVARAPQRVATQGVYSAWGWAATRARGALLSGLLVLCTGAFITSRLVDAQPPARFVPAAYHGAPYLGLSVRVEWLKTRPTQLAQQLCLPFTIIGRTQDLTDSFDIAWANQLAAHQQRPWVTLQFGEFGADGEPPLSAGLPAIANGVDDTALQRWAREIAVYGKPIYLTILLHVDRNWALSSAVANGGIPQDVPRAWEHVQAVFAAAGATNVAWVWSPADPAHDQQYAPPDTTIDVVLQSMIRYPNTPWPDPSAVLSAVEARHPGKPIFLEVSASGDPQDKAAWLEQTESAAKADAHVYALLYHEGAPDVHATQADDLQWSLESDPLSRQAVADWRALLPPGKASTCG